MQAKIVTQIFFARDTNSGTIKGSIQKVIPGGIFGFNRLEANNIQKIGAVTSLSNNSLMVDTSDGTPPTESDYIFFVKNQIINTSSLLGYYADVNFENNSKEKAELFSVNSEITESSK